MNLSFFSARSFGLAAATAVCACIGMPQASQGSIIVYNVNKSGANEAQPNVSPGVGGGTVTIDTTANTMAFNVSFSGLTGTTSNAHIHAATAVANTGIAGVATTTPSFVGFPLGVTSGTFVTTLNLLDTTTYNPAYVTANGGTIASAETALLASMAARTSYFNIHTSTFGGGEIRGFLTAVPEPSSMILSGIAMLGLAAGYRLRRKAVNV